jgi:hypothetical protein
MLSRKAMPSARAILDRSLPAFLSAAALTALSVPFELLRARGARFSISGSPLATDAPRRDWARSDIEHCTISAQIRHRAFAQVW